MFPELTDNQLEEVARAVLATAGRRKAVSL
jgi:hypothetical protein